jgi:hypothetical protein
LSERFAPPAVTDVGISFLYCHHQEQDVQTPANIIGDLLKQFIIPMSSVPSTIETIIQKNKNEQKKLELADACHMLSLALASYTNTYICIDALDECVASHRKIILQTLAQISRDCPTVRIILTGRPTVLGDINWYLGFSSPMVIRIAAKQEDIMRFISHQLDDDTYRVSMDDDFKREVVTQITSKSQEMFVFGELVNH